MPRLLVFAYDAIGHKMAGPAIRCWELAHAIARSGIDVTIASSEIIDRRPAAGGLSVCRLAPGTDTKQFASDYDAILIQGLTLERHPELASVPGALIVDMYDPWVLENLELHAKSPREDATTTLLNDARLQCDLLDAGDFFICGSERQRDYWLGMLTARNRLTPAQYDIDPELRSLIDVVPYGCSSTPPQLSTRGGLRDTLDLSPDAFVALWSGGTWEWFDPLTVLDAVEAADPAANVHLVFLGLKLESQPDMPVADELVRRISGSEQLAKRVHVADWIPYDQRGTWLLEADVAVIATRPGIESRLAFRSRILDHFWAGLPTISTRGDILSELVAERGAGWLVPFGDSRALADLLEHLAGAPLDLHEAQDASRALAAEYTWDAASRPLVNAIHSAHMLAGMRANRVPPSEKRSRRRGKPRTPGFHSRGALVDAFKRSPAYPLMRRIRRSRWGLRKWGPVPDELSHASPRLPIVAPSSRKSLRRRAASGSTHPTVSIAVVAPSTRHLGNLLDSLEQLSYPRHRVDLVVIDNGTGGKVRDAVAGSPLVRKVVLTEHNIGFAPAVNVAAQNARGEFLALINDDMRVDPLWLEALVDAVQCDDKAACAAGTILSWDGSAVDFVGGSIAWDAHGLQIAYGQKDDEVTRPAPGTRVPFACGGSMLVRRQTFVDLGGFDDTFFAYFEDVDLGWRLQLHGLQTVYAPASVAFHRHHGSSMSEPQRAFLRERNALRMIVRNVADEHLARMLCAAILGCALRADADGAEMSPQIRAVLSLSRDLPALLEGRHAIQQTRSQPDSEVFRALGISLEPHGLSTSENLRSMSALEELMGLPDLLPRHRATHVLLIEGQPGQMNDIAALVRSRAGVSPTLIPSNAPLQDLQLLALGHDLVIAPASTWKAHAPLAQSGLATKIAIVESDSTDTLHDSLVVVKPEMIDNLLETALSSPSSQPATPTTKHLLSLFQPGTSWWEQHRSALEDLLRDALATK